MRPRIHTVGHSNHTAQSLLALLKTHAIGHIVDVRSYPRSRRNPHFDRDRFKAWLADDGIAYTWMGSELGGFRKALPDSPHLALTEPGARGYADHMSGEAFGAAVRNLIELERGHTLALLCAEAQAAQCHRRFIADFLVTRGVDVLHVNAGGATPHVLSEHARLDHGVLRYDRSAQQPLF